MKLVHGFILDKAKVTKTKKGVKGILQNKSFKNYDA